MKKGKRKVLLCTLVVGFLFCYGGNYLLANGDLSDNLADVQQVRRTVTGTVADIRRDPLIGVNVSVQGTSTGAVTDQNGSYSIQVQGDNQVLQFQNSRQGTN